MIDEAQIGTTIKSLRLVRNFTLEELAQKTGYTKGYLSKVENSAKAPPVSTLIVISKALQVPVSEILKENTLPHKCSVVTRSERQVMGRSELGFGYSYETLAHTYPDKKMEPSILTIPGDSQKSAVFQHEGEEMMLVIQGRMRFFYGEKEYFLETGDCVYFDSSTPHYGLRADERDVKCVMVIYVP